MARNGFIELLGTAAHCERAARRQRSDGQAQLIVGPAGVAPAAQRPGTQLRPALYFIGNFARPGDDLGGQSGHLGHGYPVRPVARSVQNSM
jgi:hypothetical protein